MEYALIINKDLTFSRRLRQSLAKVRQLKVIVVPTVVDAQLAIMRQAQDWVFIPFAEDVCKTAVSLYNLQPDTRLILITPPQKSRPLVPCADKIEGIIRQNWHDDELREMMETAVISNPFEVAVPSGNQVDTAILIAALQQVKVDKVVQTAVIARDGAYLAHWGQHTITQARYIVRLVGREWLSAKSQTRLQFMSQPGDADDLLLYTYRVTDHDYFIFTALPETPIAELRQRAAGLATLLSDLLKGNAAISIDDVMFSARGDNSYAVVWRAIRALPAKLHQPIQTAIERLATANACRIIHTDIQSTYVHLVISCPSGKGKRWVANLFKKGSETTIQQQSNVNTPLWDHGFYVTASKRPLTDLELRLFLKK